MPMLVKMDIDQDSCRLRDSGEYWPEGEGIDEELIEAYCLQEITEADLPKPLSSLSPRGVWLFKKESQGITEYFAFRLGNYCTLQ